LKNKVEGIELLICGFAMEMLKSRWKILLFRQLCAMLLCLAGFVTALLEEYADGTIPLLMLLITYFSIVLSLFLLNVFLQMFGVNFWGLDVLH
jgi:hypothetical protein